MSIIIIAFMSHEYVYHKKGDYHDCSICGIICSVRCKCSDISKSSIRYDSDDLHYCLGCNQTCEFDEECWYNCNCKDCYREEKYKSVDYEPDYYCPLCHSLYDDCYCISEFNKLNGYYEMPLNLERLWHLEVTYQSSRDDYYHEAIRFPALKYTNTVNMTSVLICIDCGNSDARIKVTKSKYTVICDCGSRLMLNRNLVDGKRLSIDECFRIIFDTINGLIYYSSSSS